MATTDVGICSNALLRLGAKSISSFADGTDRSSLAGNVYPFRKDFILSIYPWRFNTFKQQLGRDTTAPISKWLYRYSLPPTRLLDGNVAVYNSDQSGATPITNYEVLNEYLYTDETKIYVDFQTDTDEALWPAYFQELMVKAMMVEFAMPITDQQSTRESLYVEVYGTANENGVGGLLGLCMARNGQESPPKTIHEFSLVAVRN